MSIVNDGKVFAVKDNILRVMDLNIGVNMLAEGSEPTSETTVSDSAVNVALGVPQGGILPDTVNNNGKLLGIQKDALAWIDYIIAGATGGVTIKSGASDNVGLTIKGAEGQTANYFEVKDYNNNKICWLNANSQLLYISGIANKNGGSNSYISPLNTGTLISRNIADGNPALIVDLENSASTGNILELRKDGSTKVKFDNYGHMTVYASWIRIASASTPTSSTDSGIKGMHCWDSDYIYVCVEGDSWKRAALTSW